MMDINQESVEAVPKGNVPGVLAGKPGSYCFVYHPDSHEPTTVILKVPGGQITALPLVATPDVTTWEWDGDTDLPTMKPGISVSAKDGKEGWVGYFTDGQFVAKPVVTH